MSTTHNKALSINLDDKIYGQDVKVYVQPMPLADVREHLQSVGLDPQWIATNDDSGAVSIDNLRLEGLLRLLQQYLIESGFVKNLANSV